MRISDWSSDVCSSDLIANLGIALHRVDEEYAVIEALPEEAARVMVGLCGMRPEAWIKIGIGAQQIAEMVELTRATGHAVGFSEIGRTSGRERVFYYFLISVYGVTYKN